MRRTMMIVGLAMAASVACRRPLAAQWRIDAQGGALVPVGDAELEKDDISISSDFDVGGSVAVGGAYGVHELVDLTARFQSGFTTLDAFDDALNVYSFTAGARLFVLPAYFRVRPWLGFAVGWYHVDADLTLPGPNIDESDDSFGINAGGGLDVRINHRISLGLDVRYHNAFDALDGLEFVTPMFNVGIHFGSPWPPLAN